VRRRVSRCLAAAAAILLCCGRARAETLPSAFASRANPHAGEVAARDDGRKLFLENCSQCHGEAADGHGPAAQGLVPPPANLAGPAVVPQHSDAYLFYRLTVGKSGTAMPSFHGVLSEDERWTIVTYLRSLAQQAPEGREPAAAGPVPAPPGEAANQAAPTRLAR